MMVNISFGVLELGLPEFEELDDSDNDTDYVPSRLLQYWSVG